MQRDGVITHGCDGLKLNGVHPVYGLHHAATAAATAAAEARDSAAAATASCCPVVITCSSSGGGSGSRQVLRDQLLDGHRGERPRRPQHVVRDLVLEEVGEVLLRVTPERYISHMYKRIQVRGYRYIKRKEATLLA